MTTSLTDVLEARAVLHRYRPKWLPPVIATGVRNQGPRVTNDWSISVVVDRKRARRGLSLWRQIPSSIDGIPIHVEGPLPGDGATAVGAGASAMGSGADIAGRFGENGTAACVALTTSGEPALVASGHVVLPSDVAFRWATQDRAPVGRGGVSRGAIGGAELYGAAARAEESFQVEATRVDGLKDLALHGGLADGMSFGGEKTVLMLDWLTGAAVRSYGAGSGGWRSGFVRILFPRRPDVPLTGLCLIQETSARRSEKRDSGSLWVAEAEDGLVAIGLHWGYVWREAGSTRYTFVTELEAALPFLGLATLVGNAAWTVEV